MSGKRKPERLQKKRAYFKLTAPDAEEVFLCGSFNGWDPTARSMKRDAKGVWRTHTMLAPGVYEYRFIVDGEWQNDPAAETTPNPHGTHNSVRTV